MGKGYADCLLCNRFCESDRYSNAEIHWFRCPSCGDYSATETAGIVRTWSGLDRRRLSACTRERIIHGFAPLVLHDGTNDIELVQEFCPSRIVRDVQDILRNVFPHRMQDRLDRVVLNLCAMTSEPGAAVTVVPDIDYPVLMAESSSSAKFVLLELISRNLIRDGGNSQRWLLTLTADGFDRAQQAQSELGREKSIQAFVAMWFATETDGAYSDGFVPGIGDCGFRPLRIDGKQTNNKICDEIIAEIRRSRFVVADFTGQRGGVYYEAGFAMGLGIPVIWTCRNDCIDDLHFDTRQYAHIVWETPADLRKQLAARIRALIPGAKYSE